MHTVTLNKVVERLELADELLAGRQTMFEPQDLPGRYGRVVKAVDHLLGVLRCESVVSGGWAVWHHGFVGRLTQDIDIVLPAARLDEFLDVSCVSGFDVSRRWPARWPTLTHRDTSVKRTGLSRSCWPKLTHRETGIGVDILPEGARPGTPTRPAPTTIPAPAAMGADEPRLKYISLAALVELKLAAGRIKDEADVVELIRANPESLSQIRQHLDRVHADYAAAFDRLVDQARESEDRA
jgi:hypothetical protein